jgi:hypothetical protein
MFGSKREWMQTSREVFPVDEIEQAGAQGEKMVFDCANGVLPRLGCRGKIYQALRVPKSQTLGKFEIDVLIVSERGILSIEVKHWSGLLAAHSGSWQQERGSDRRVLPDPVRLQHEKKEALVTWLHRQGIKVAKEHIQALVVLSHPAVRLHASLQKLREVITLDQLPAHMQQCLTAPRRFFWQKKIPVSFVYKELIEQLGRLPTWDRIELNGGRTYAGDIETLGVYDLKQRALSRKSLQSARLIIARNHWLGLLFHPRLRILDWQNKVSYWAIDPYSKLTMSLAGKNKKIELMLLNVRTLKLGWKDQSYYD